MPPKKKSPVGLIIALIVGLLSICCIVPLGLLGYGLKKGLPMVGDIVTCSAGMTVARRALLDYEAKNGKFPPAATWQDDIEPFYVQRAGKLKHKDNLGPFTMWKAQDDWVCSTAEPKSGIAYNADLAGKSSKDFKGEDVLLYEVPTVGRNQSGPYKERPRKSGPEIFGNKRNWLTERIDGAHSGNDFDVQTKDTSDDSSDGADGDSSYGADGDDGSSSDSGNGKNGKPGKVGKSGSDGDDAPAEPAAPKKAKGAPSDN
jgi:hypothetical protein